MEVILKVPLDNPGKMSISDINTFCINNDLRFKEAKKSFLIWPKFEIVNEEKIYQLRDEFSKMNFFQFIDCVEEGGCGTDFPSQVICGPTGFEIYPYYWARSGFVNTKNPIRARFSVGYCVLSVKVQKDGARRIVIINSWELSRPEDRENTLIFKRKTEWSGYADKLPEKFFKSSIYMAVNAACDKLNCDGSCEYPHYAKLNLSLS